MIYFLIDEPTHNSSTEQEGEGSGEASGEGSGIASNMIDAHMDDSDDSLWSFELFKTLKLLSDTIICAILICDDPPY